MAADLLTKYYTDYEPQSTFVAIMRWTLVGYINGCMDNRRYGLVMFWLLMPALLIKAFKRGIFFRPEIRQLLRGALKIGAGYLFGVRNLFIAIKGICISASREIFAVSRWVGIWSRPWWTMPMGMGIAELAASVHDANKAAGDFFEAQGFSP